MFRNFLAVIRDDIFLQAIEPNDTASAKAAIAIVFFIVNIFNVKIGDQI